jgi:S1-C subfamily serine protease
VIRWVEQNGPADQAGLEEGDAITAVNGQALSPQKDLATILQAFKPGERIQVTYWRAGSAGRQGQQTVDVILGSRRDEQGATVAYLGIRYSLVEGRNLASPVD